MNFKFELHDEVYSLSVRYNCIILGKMHYLPYRLNYYLININTRDAVLTESKIINWLGNIEYQDLEIVGNYHDFINNECAWVIESDLMRGYQYA